MSKLAFTHYARALGCVALLISASILADDAPSEPAENQPVTSQHLPIFNEILSFNLPQGWRQAHHERQGDMFIAEFVPAAQELRDWSSLVCVQGFKNLSENIDPQEFLDSMVSTYREHCQGEVIFERLPAGEVNGRESANAIIGCTSMPNMHHNSLSQIGATETASQGEIGFYTVLKGEQDLYLIHKSMRGETFTTDLPPLDESNHEEFMSSVAPLTVHH